MGKVILGVTISLDGFAEDRDGSVGALYPDLDALHDTEVLRESQRNTGSVVMAWKEFAMGEDNPDSDWWAGNYEYQVPIFVFGSKTPQKHPKETDSLTFTFVKEGIRSAIQKAKVAAGERDVTIIGSASTTKLCLNAGLVDELHFDIIPIFLGGGFRPFDDIDTTIKLERIETVELPAGRTHLVFRVVK